MKILITFIVFFCISFFGQGHFRVMITGISGWIAIGLFIVLLVKLIKKIFSPYKNPEIAYCSLCGEEFIKITASTFVKESRRRYLLKFNKYIK